MLSKLKINSKKDLQQLKDLVLSKYPINSYINDNQIIGYDFKPVKRYLTRKYKYETRPLKHFFNSITVLFKVKCRNCGKEHYATYNSLIRSKTCHYCQSRSTTPYIRSTIGKNNLSKNLSNCPFSHISFCTFSSRASTYLFSLHIKGHLYRKMSKNLNTILKYRRDTLSNTTLYSKMLEEDISTALKYPAITETFLSNYRYLISLDPALSKHFYTKYSKSISDILEDE